VFSRCRPQARRAINGGKSCFAIFSLPSQRSFSSPPASFQMMRLPAAGVAVDFMAGECVAAASMAAVACEEEVTVAARSQLGGTGVALLLYAEATAIEAATAATAMVPQPWELQLSARRRSDRLITAGAAATTPMATGFARTGTNLTELHYGPADVQLIKKGPGLSPQPHKDPLVVPWRAFSVLILAARV
jgi:hypothetical protein